MLGFGSENRMVWRTGARARRAVSATGLLFLLLLGQLVFAAPAQATNWVVNITDTGFDPIPLGGTIIYSISVENEDVATATAPENNLNLTIPAGFTFTGATGTITGCGPVPAAGLTTVSCTIPPLPGGQTVTLQASVRTSTQGTFTVDAAVPTLGIDTEPANNTASQATTVIDGTDMALAVSGPAQATSGSVASYIFTATNNGPLPASNVQVTIPAPVGLHDIAVPANCSFASPNYLCTVAGPIAVGGAAAIALSGQVGVASTSSIVVAGSITGSSPPDPIPFNDTATATTTVDGGSDVKITKARSPSGTLLVGGNATFTLTASYTGESPNGLTIIDEIPGNFQIDSVTPSPGSGWTCGTAGQIVTCTRPSGDGPGHNVPLGSIAIATTVVSGGSATNIAEISAESPPDPNPANNTATDGGVVINDKTADLRANKAGPANPPTVLEGQEFRFGISTSNIGNQPFTGTVVMTDALPAGLQVNSMTLAGWNCTPTAAPGSPVVGPATITCSRVYTEAQPLPVGATTPSVSMFTVSNVSTPTSFTNRMTVSTENANFPDPNLVNNTITYGVNSTGSTAFADVQLLKTARNATIESGEVEIFDIEIVNLGTSPSSTVNVSDDFTNLINNRSGPADGLVSVAHQPNAASGMTCSLTGIGGSTGTSGRLACVIGTLPVCTVGVDCPTITVSVRPGGDAGTRTNSARAVSNITFDPNLNNNTGTASYEVTARADVTVTKDVTPPSPIAGQAFTYIISAQVLADGRSAATDVTITDTLPAGLIFLSATPSTGSCSVAPTARVITGSGQNEVVCNLGTIANGAQQTVEIRVAPTTELRGQTITNNVVVTSPTAGDDPANNAASVAAFVQPPSLDLQINKVDTPTPEFGPDPVGIGTTMVYGLQIRNNGPSAAQQVVVTDTLPASFLSFVSYSAPAGVTCSVVPATGSIGGTLQCSLPLLMADESRLITITMQGEARGVAVNTATVSSLESSLGFDSNTANNQDSESTTVRTRADVELVSKVPSQTPVTILQPFSFDVRVRNNTGPGLGEAETVVLTDTLPPGMQLTGAPTAVVTVGTATSSICSGSAGATSFSCEFGTMSSGAEVIVTVPVRVVESSAAQQTFTNTASVGTSSLEVDISNNTNSGQVTVEAASLAGLVFRDFNGNGVQDPGDTGISGVSMQVAGVGPGNVPVGVTVTTASDGSYLFAALPPGTFAVTRGAVSDAGLSDGIARPGSAGGTVVSATQISGVTLTTGAATGYDFTLVPNSGIAIAKALLSGPTANADGTFDASFRLTVSNPSIEVLQNIIVTDQLAGAPPLFGNFAATPSDRGTYTVIAAPSGSCGGLNAGFNGSGDTAAAQGASLAVGASCTVDFTIRVMPTAPLPPLVDGGRYVNQASVSGSGAQSGNDLTSASNLVPLAPELPQLTITKVMTGYADVDNSGSISLGDVLTFEITATNAGSVPLTDVVVSDTMISPDSTTCAVLQPDETCALTGTYTVAIADVQAGSVVNTATADSTETNPVTGPVTASVTTPVVAVIDKNTLSKTALVNTVKRGEQVPYVIAAQDVPFTPARIVDVMPPGFAFVDGSAVANGEKVVPTVDGRRLTFDGLLPDAQGDIKLELTLVATASVTPGTAVNQAQLVDPDTGQVVATARARVTILAEALFDCGDIIGKVFDDKNRNGYQDEGEPGLAAVRVASVNGLLITTDAHGRFNIPCAEIPDAAIGTNFIVKLDTRTLPTGYHLTTENPRRVRLTGGKVVKLNFGASLSRLVKLELNGKVFEQGSEALKPKWAAGLDRLIAALAAESSVLEITYRGEGALAKARLRSVKREIAQRWAAVPDHYDLPIETRLVSGAAP